MVEHAAESLVQQHLPQVDELDHVPHFGRVEEAQLLLIAEHFERRLAEHAEVKRRARSGRRGKHDLMDQSRLARTGRAGDQVERIFRHPAAQHLV